MSNRILIHLNKTDFTGGEIIEGELEVQIDTAIPVRAVRVLLHGYEQSYWSRGSGRIRSSGTGRHRQTYSETLDLFREEMTLFGDPPLDAAALISDSVTGLFTSGHYHTLKPGNYRYPFSYTLPEHLPGDYDDEADRSKIEYRVKGYLDIPLKIDIEKTVPLTVYENIEQSAEQALSASNDKTFVFESTTAFEARITLDKNIYFPGDTANCRLRVVNQSKKDVQAVAISLQKRESLHAQDSSTFNSGKIHTQNYDNSSIVAGETKEIEVQFSIPNNLYPTILSGKLVQVEYQIVATLDIPWAIDLDIEVPIVLLEEAGRPSGRSSAKPVA